MNTPNWAPQHAIWFQRLGHTTAYVSLVNNAYQYEIFGKYGDTLKKGDSPSLPEAKKEVLAYLQGDRR